MSTDLFQAPDYFQLDELLNDEHKLVREAARDWVKREVSPIIEDSCQAFLTSSCILSYFIYNFKCSRLST